MDAPGQRALFLSSQQRAAPDLAQISLQVLIDCDVAPLASGGFS
jgi:hypothetical protein